jgi:hypothetical protein
MDSGAAFPDEIWLYDCGMEDLVAYCSGDYGGDTAWGGAAYFTIYWYFDDWSMVGGYVGV